MSERVGIRFRIGDLFPANDPVARWLTVCAMALNDLLLLNRWLVPSLENDGPAYVNVYLARLEAAHLYEIAKFLRESEKNVTEVGDFVAGLGEEKRAAYERVKAAGLGGDDAFGRHLERARHQFFHYPELVPHAPDFEKLRKAITEHADTTGEIHDPGTFVDKFRALFADDIATELSFPDEDVDLVEFIPILSARISDYLTFAPAALARRVELASSDSWEWIVRDESREPDPAN